MNMFTLFESLVQKMNSAQNMNPAIGFNATLTFVTYPEKGGKGPARNNPGRLPFDMMHKKKDCMIKIDNSDARAIGMVPLISHWSSSTNEVCQCIVSPSKNHHGSTTGQHFGAIVILGVY